jgi:hypothetical protein
MTFCRWGFRERTRDLAGEDGWSDQFVDHVLEIGLQLQSLARVGPGRTQQRAAEASRTYLMSRRRPTASERSRRR